MRRVVLAALVLACFRVEAQDVLSVGSGSTNATVTITKVTASSVQGIAFKVLFDGNAIASMAFARTGALATQTPLYEASFQGSGWFSYAVLFAAPTNASGQIGMLMPSPSAGSGSVIALTLHPASAMLSNQSSSVIETVANGNLALSNGSITVSSVAAPTGLTATASGTAQVNVTWNAVAGADSYEVWRSVDGHAYALAGNPASTSFSDLGVSAGKTYLYRVRTIDGLQTSPFSNVKVATTIVFTDDPIVAGSTRIKAVHMSELRSAINAMRASASLPLLAADATIGSGQRIRAQHITDVRTALSEARASIGLPSLSYTDATLTLIKAAHVQELRERVK